MVINIFKVFNFSYNIIYRDNMLGNSYLLWKLVKIVYNNVIN